MSDPFDIDESLADTERLSLDIPKSDAEFLTRLAAYRNAMAIALEKRLRRQWSRKSLTERVVSRSVSELREGMKEMVVALGEIPSADDQSALNAYVKRVIAWDKKRDR